MEINQIPTSTPQPSNAALNRATSKVEQNIVQTVNKINPMVDRSPAQINRSYEMSKDPPITILKYTNTLTKNVELQIPSETSMQIYRATQQYIEAQKKRDWPEQTVNIQV